LLYTIVSATAGLIVNFGHTLSVGLLVRPWRRRPWCNVDASWPHRWGYFGALTWAISYENIATFRWNTSLACVVTRKLSLPIRHWIVTYVGTPRVRLFASTVGRRCPRSAATQNSGRLFRTIILSIQIARSSCSSRSTAGMFSQEGCQAPINI